MKQYLVTFEVSVEVLGDVDDAGGTFTQKFVEKHFGVWYHGPNYDVVFSPGPGRTRIRRANIRTRHQRVRVKENAPPTLEGRELSWEARTSTRSHLTIL